MLAWSMGRRIGITKAVNCNLICIAFFCNGESSTEALKRGFTRGQGFNPWFLDMTVINVSEIHPKRHYCYYIQEINYV